MSDYAYAYATGPRILPCSADCAPRAANHPQHIVRCAWSTTAVVGWDVEVQVAPTGVAW